MVKFLLSAPGKAPGQLHLPAKVGAFYKSWPACDTETGTWQRWYMSELEELQIVSVCTLLCQTCVNKAAAEW